METIKATLVIDGVLQYIVYLDRKGIEEILNGNLDEPLKIVAAEGKSYPIQNTAARRVTTARILHSKKEGNGNEKGEIHIELENERWEGPGLENKGSPKQIMFVLEGGYEWIKASSEISTRATQEKTTKTSLKMTGSQRA